MSEAGDVLPTGGDAVDDPSGRRRRFTIIAAAALGVLASVVLAAVFASADARLERARFDELAHEDTQAISRALERMTDMVTIEKAFIEATEKITLARFLSFARTARDTLSIGLRNTTWAPRVTGAERAGFEQAARAEGLAGFQIRDLGAADSLVRASDRAEYFPDLYTDSAEVDSADFRPKVLGFDVASEPQRLQALLRARATALPAVTSMLKLFRLPSGARPGGFLIFVPVLGGASGDGDPLRGFIVGVLETGRLVEHALAGKPAEQDLDAYVFDPSGPIDRRLIYRHSSGAGAEAFAAKSETALRALPHAEARLPVADREWGILLTRPAPALAIERLGERGLTALLIGLIATGVMVAYLSATLRHALRLETLTLQLRRTGDDLRRKSDEVARLARHDALTGLPNRTTFHEQLRKALGQSVPCVLCIDLDRFKAVNDTFGHPAGDALLVLVAARLRACLRPKDMAARMGGDEFAILLLEQDAAGAESVARRVVDSVGQPYDIDGQGVAIGVSVGIAFPADGSADADLLMRNADLALYRAKQSGRGTWRFFQRDMEVAAQARRAMEANLRQALADMAFDLHFQPVIRLSDRHVCGFEALLRWNCPGIGPVSPAEFVPLAEECGLIVPIGDWVLQAACREATRWPAGVRIAVNLSPAQFMSTTLVASVAAALAAAGLAPARLELEITETLLLQDSRETLATLHALKALGVSISMDDFGTGYSSLSYLRKFPFDTLKIDQGFVRDLPTRKDCRAIVHAVTGLCRSLGITTVAEGVETEEQLRGVLAEGCDEVQGYLFSRPVPAAEVAALLTAREHIAAA